jgi:alpha-tubulin suppressor-like RCC1 family protein/uncharacterized protein YjdB
MIDVRGNAVVTDFGIAKLKGGKGLTVHGAAIGTPQYMSPEQCLSQEIGPASDQYSLGIVAYHMLSGQPPFAGAPLAVMRSQVDDNPPPLRMLRDEPCPQEVRDALDRMLAKDPESRFPKVIEAVRVMRGHPLGPDDPVRQELAQLVKRPDFIPPTAVFTTPMSPSPSVAPSAPPAPPTPPPSAPAPEGAPPSVTSPPGAAEPLSGRMGQAPPAPTAPVSPAASVMPPATPVPETMALAGPPTLRISGVPRAIKTGESVRLRARLIEPSGSEAIPSEVVWTSSNPSVAVVDSDGRVHALAVGTASIRGAAEGLSVAADVTVQGLRRLRWPLGAAASAGVVVVATAIFLLWPRPAPKPMTVAIQPASLTLGVGQEATFVIPGMPEGESVVWSSSAPAVATVDAVGRAYGMATGTALIVARVGSVADTATVTVESLPRYVAAIRLSPSDAEVLVGQEVRLAAVALDSSGVPVGGSAITWRSENEARATVSADGRVRGLAPGSVRVLAASAGIEAAAEISVVAPRRAEPPRVRVATVEIRPPEVALRTGETQTLVATPLDGRGTRLSRPVTWQSDDQSVARVSSAGLVTAVGEGRTQVEANSEGRSAWATVTVEPVPGGGAEEVEPAGLDDPLASAAASNVVAGRLHTCIWSGAGQTWCWGGNDAGQVQPGGAGSLSRPTEVSVTSATLVAAGGTHTCVLSDGRAVCWGRNSEGQLGSADRNATSVAIQGVRFGALAAGWEHTCGISSGGDALCWGKNDRAQLGDGSTRGRSQPTPVATRERFRALVAGARHTCGLRPDGRALCWGDNWSGQVGTSMIQSIGDPTPVGGNDRYAVLTAGGEHTCGLRTDGQLRCWGGNGSGQLGAGSTRQRTSPVAVQGGRRFAVVTAGGAHTCALTQDGQPFCWGRGREGQLGSGERQDRHVPTPVRTGQRFLAIAAGDRHTCGLTDDRQVLCWGQNSSGQLGTGGGELHVTPTAVSDFR